MLIDTRLRKALNFKEDDLIANRDGYMTKAQRKRLRQDQMDVGYGCLAAGFLFPLVMLCQVISSVSTGHPLNGFGVAWVLFGFVLLAAAAGFFYSHRRNVIADLRKGNVLMLEGYVEITPLKHHKMHLQIENVGFTIRETSAFNTESVYRIYYAEHTMHPLSAEVVKGKL
jgi:hypothetical protein